MYPYQSGGYVAVATKTRAYPLYVNVLRARVDSQQNNVNCVPNTCFWQNSLSNILSSLEGTD